MDVYYVQVHLYFSSMLCRKYIEVMVELRGLKQSLLTTHYGQSQKHITTATYFIKIAT